MSSHRWFQTRICQVDGGRSDIPCNAGAGGGPSIRLVIAAMALVFPSGSGEAKPRELRPLRPIESRMPASPEALPKGPAVEEGNRGEPGLSSGTSPVSSGSERGFTGSKPDEVAVASRKIRVPLSRFTKGKTVRLQGTSADLRFTVPVNPRMRVNAVRVGLGFVPSISLEDRDSHLSIEWNGKTLSARMEPVQNGQWSRWLTGVIDLDPGSSSENELRIGAVHSGLGEKNGIGTPPPAMWTEIDLEASWIELGYGWRPADLEAGDFARLVDCRPWLESRIAVVTPSLDDGNDDYLRWGGWVAQWMGLSLGERMPELVHRTGLAAVDADAVVIGAQGELPRLLSAEMLEQTGEGDVRLFTNPENPRHLVLLLTGADREAVGGNVRRFVESQEAKREEEETEFLSPRSPFAFVREPVGVKSGEPLRLTFHAAARDSDTVAAVWMLAGKIARFAAGPPGGMEITGLPPSGKGHWILAGPLSGIDRSILSFAPVDLPGEGQLPALLAPAWGRVLENVKAAGPGAGQPRQQSGEGLLMRFDSPFGRGYTATVVTADDSAGLHRAVKTLIEPAIWNQISGNAVSWGGERGETVECRFLSGTGVAGDRAHGGDGARNLLWNPWIIGGLGTIGLVVLVMRRRRTANRQRRHGFEWHPWEEPVH